MISKRTKILSYLTLSLLLTSCDDPRFFQQTGEWQYEDLMYIKNQGTDGHECDPIGWIIINDKKTDCILDRQPGREVHFKYYNIDEDTIGETFCRADAKLLGSGNIKIDILNDYTETYASNTKFILEKLS